MKEKNGKLINGHIYYDIKDKREVEFGYMGSKGDAVCYEPGDSGGGMQSAFLVDPENLVPVGKDALIRSHPNLKDYPILFSAYEAGYIGADETLEKLEKASRQEYCPLCGQQIR